jgi:hypothetical protein
MDVILNTEDSQLPNDNFETQQLFCKYIYLIFYLSNFRNK